MNRDTLQKAIDEARRFIKLAQETQNGYYWHPYKDDSGGFWTRDSYTATAATKRASMDLTRALANMRKPA